MQTIKARDFKPGMIIRFIDGQGLASNKPKQMTVGEVDVRDSEVLVYLSTAREASRYSMNPDRNFGLVDVA